MHCFRTSRHWCECRQKRSQCNEKCTGMRARGDGWKMRIPADECPCGGSSLGLHAGTENAANSVIRCRTSLGRGFMNFLSDTCRRQFPIQGCRSAKGQTFYQIRGSQLVKEYLFAVKCEIKLNSITTLNHQTQADIYVLLRKVVVFMRNSNKSCLKLI